MGLRKFITGLFGSSLPQERQEAEVVSADDQHKDCILTALATVDEGLRIDTLIHVLYVRRANTWKLLGKEILRLLNELVSDGFVQRLGREDDPFATYVISDNDLNRIGLPGR